MIQCRCFLFTYKKPNCFATHMLSIHQHKSDLDENKLTQVLSIASHIYPSCFRRAVIYRLDRTISVARYKNVLVKACVWTWPVSIAFQQSSYHWLIYFICQNLDISNENFSYSVFMFCHYGALYSAHFSYTNTQISCRN